MDHIDDTARPVKNVVDEPELVEKYLNTYQQQLDIPDDPTGVARNIISQYYTTTDDHSLRWYEHTVPAALSIACNKHHTPRTLQDFTNVTIDTGLPDDLDFNKPELTTNDLQKEKQHIKETLGITEEPVTATDYLERYLKGIPDTDGERHDIAREVLREIEQEHPDIPVEDQAINAIKITTQITDGPDYE